MKQWVINNRCNGSTDQEGAAELRRRRGGVFRLLPELPEDLAAYAAEKLEKRGVEIRLGTAIDSATGTSASFADGSLIEIRTCPANRRIG